MANTLLHSPAEVIQQLLIDLGLGTSPEVSPLQAWPVYSTNEPADGQQVSDNVITVYDTTGKGSGRSMHDGQVLGNFGFQIRVRARDHTTGWQKADAIQTTLAESVYQETVGIGSSRYFVHAVVNVGDVLALGTEAPGSRRSVFTINALCPIRQTA